MASGLWKKGLDTLKSSTNTVLHLSRQTAFLAMSAGLSLGSFGHSFLGKNTITQLQHALARGKNRMNIRSMEYALLQKSRQGKDTSPTETAQYKMHIAEHAAAGQIAAQRINNVTSFPQKKSEILNKHGQSTEKYKLPHIELQGKAKLMPHTSEKTGWEEKISQSNTPQQQQLATLR